MHVAAGEGERQRVWLTDGEYRRLVEAAETHRERLLVRLGGEAGLRPAETTRVRAGDHLRRDVAGRTHHFLRVPAGDEGDEATDGAADDDAGREAYLPTALAEELALYVRSNDLGEADRVVSVTPRRVQMLVGEVADRAAASTGEDGFGAVTMADLRRYFARTLLADCGLDPAVVMAVGGWQSLSALSAYLETPSADDVAVAFARAGPFDPDRGGWSPAQRRQAIERAGHLVYFLDADGALVDANAAYASLTGLDRDRAAGRVPWHSDEETQADLWETLHAGETWHGRLRHRSADGVPRAVEQSVAPVRAGGDLAGYVGVGRPAEVATGTAGTTPDAPPDAVVDAVRAVGEVVDAASTRAELERGACRRLVRTAAYDTAWLCARPTEPEESFVRAAVGPDSAEGGAAVEGLAERAIETGGLRVDAGEDAAVAAVPLVHDGSVHGALVVRATGRAISPRERPLLVDAGRRLGHALAAVEARRLLVADTVVELTFEVGGGDAPVLSTARRLDTDLAVEGLVPGEGDALLYFVTATDADAASVLAAAEGASGVSAARLLQDHGETALFELTVTGKAPARSLIRAGGRVRENGVTGGTQALVAEFAPDVDVREVVDHLTEPFPAATLTAKRERDRAEQAASTARSPADSLTDKQEQVLQAAYLAGYFEWPRGSTAEELADSMGVSSPTLHKHLRKAQQKLLTWLFERASPAGD
jgi:PAS domain S-box-containing protein